MNNATKQYVVGFVFGVDKTFGAKSVVLIKKDHPAWQAGRLNGVGGKVEDGERPSEAMSRELLEEAGVYVAPDSWKHFATLSGLFGDVRCFHVTNQLAYDEAKTRTSEEIVRVAIEELWSHKRISNLDFLIHAALDENDGGGTPFIQVYYPVA